MKNVFTASDPAQAHLVAGMLEEAGIRCFVEGEMLFGVRGDLGLTPASLPRITVSDDDAVRAVEILRARERAAAVDRAEPDEDAVPPHTPWRAALTITVLWLLLAAVSSHVVGPVALPFVAVCLFVHMYLHFDRAS